MTVTDVVTDREAQTLTLTAEYRAPVERVWQLWADPRLLERWWGPPTYPATVVDHDLTVWGRVTYYMTGPEGDRHYGWWQVTAVDGPTSLEFDDGFADAEGNPSPDLPVTHTRVTVADAGSGVTRMVITSTFPSPEAFDQLIAMGIEEGLTAAVGQTDELLTAAAER
jgi:uncharacterized protein YndB with AHSA1/START domain